MINFLNFLKEPDNKNLWVLLKKDDNYKMVFIIIIFSLFPIINSISEWASNWFLSFFSSLLGLLISEAIFVAVVLLVWRLLNAKAKFLDLFYIIASANILLIISSFFVNILTFLAPRSLIMSIISSIIWLVFWLWYLYVWIKWVSYVNKISTWDTIILAVSSFVVTWIFYFLLATWLVWLMIIFS